jgi:septum formation protein
VSKCRFILASASPRRKELLTYLSIPFEINPSTIEESSSREVATMYAEDIARQKGSDVFNKLVGSDKSIFVVSSDTIVVLDGQIFGKPTDEQDVRYTLRQLSGRTHQVITAVAMHFFDPKTGEEINLSFHQETDVTFCDIDSQTLDLYIASGESLDKAGAYGIQGMGLIFIKEIKGSYSNVVGFPLELFHQELQKIFSRYYANEDYRSFF